MNWRIILKFLSILILIVSVFMILPLSFSIYYSDNAYFGFIISIIIGAIIGILGLSLIKDNENKILSKKGGFLLVTLSWIVIAIFGSIPYMISMHMSITNSFFETMSGFTTTGASILTDIESVPKSILFWRSLTHWLGGMGIIVLSVAVLPMLGIGGMQLIKAEAPGPTVEKISPRIAETAKYLWLVYFLLSAIETILLLFGGMNLFDALTHTFGTMATGGFSTKNTSVAYFHSAYIDFIITVFMFIAGMNFSLHFKILTGKFKAFKDEELRFYALLTTIAILVVSLNILNKYGNFFEALRYGSFQVVSIMTTTGYATADYTRWPYFSQAILFLLMFVGGCSGSTGGSIKVIRILILLKQSINELKYHIHSKGIFTLTMNGQLIRKNIVYLISSFFFLYITTFFITALLISMFNIDLLTSLSASAAALGNIGPGFGLVGPSLNYNFLPAAVKWILSFAMLIGRLEIYTVFVIFMKNFWVK